MRRREGEKKKTPVTAAPRTRGEKKKKKKGVSVYIVATLLRPPSVREGKKGCHRIPFTPAATRKKEGRQNLS